MVVIVVVMGGGDDDNAVKLMMQVEWVKGESGHKGERLRIRGFRCSRHCFRRFSCLDGWSVI